MMKKSRRGFTLIELLVVIAIVGLLASIILVSLGSAREKAKAAKVYVQVRQVRLALELYVTDVGHYPTASCMRTCSESEDPLWTDLGEPGWDGPYFKLWGTVHPWGGHVGITSTGDDGSLDWDGDGIDDGMALYLDDDAPSGPTNTGLVPVAIMQQIDEEFDDGNLTTGDIRGNIGGLGWPNKYVAIGELVMKMGITNE